MRTATAALGIFTEVPLLAQRETWVESQNYDDYASNDIPDLGSLGTDPYLDQALNLRSIRTYPALPDEVSKGDSLLLSSPKNGSPLDVMKYLESLQEINIEGEPYNAGWRTRWNPVIVRFFQEGDTKLNPAGDRTPWCAACVNWTLWRSGLHGTGSASSSSFRTAPGLTRSPVAGDIAVFKSTDPAEAAAGHGHVGLFLSETPTHILVLGGNQIKLKSHHAVSMMQIAKKGNNLTLHSYHAITAFKS
jgi:uncharacterized protein (TIGR02594 family)